MAQKFEYTVLELIESASRNNRALPLNLGGVGGALGGPGGPAGGIIGWLPQTRVAYDETEAATLATAPSGLNAPSGWSLLDNLNHIRYRIEQLEVGSGIIIVDDQVTFVDDINQITFTGAVVVSDMGGGRALVTITASGGGGGPVTGTPNRVAIFDSAGDLTTDSGLVYDEIDDTLSFGPFLPATADFPNAFVHTAASGVSAGYAQFSIGMSPTIAPFHTFFRARGDYTTYQAVKDADVMGRLRGRAYNGTAWEPTQAEIRYVVVGDHTGSNYGTKIEFHTTPSGSTTLTKGFTVEDDGDVNIESGKTYNIGGVPHSHAGGSSIFQRILTADLTLNNGESLVVAGYIDASAGYSIILNGDAELHLL